MKKKKVDYVRIITTTSSNVIFGIKIIRYCLLSRRHHLLPLISSAAAAVLLFVFALLSYLSPPITNHHHLYHSRYYFKMVGSNVEKEMMFRVPNGGGGGIFEQQLWSSSRSKYYYGCSNSGSDFLSAEVKTNPDRYLMIATSGGLNQQRTGIVDAVVTAHILNATLVVPNLDQKSYWKDKSNFSEIFDVDWFISYLSRDVEIIKHLPSREGRVMTPHSTRVPRKCNSTCYVNRVLPVLKKKRVSVSVTQLQTWFHLPRACLSFLAVQLTKFDYRLSNRLETDLQKLRCRVNYHALKFTSSITEMGRKLVDRMRMKSGKFIALHIRFESDMLAFSGCYYGGGEKERQELGAIRKRWKTLHASNPDKERRNGKCPLTPEEVGLMLRALGFDSDVHIYVASGEVYGGEETLAPLKALFPNFHTKETLASKEEMAPFSDFSSRMAALDFIVCDQSDVFVTNNNGNMARMLAGRRRYFGHKPTIRPNAKKLSQLFINRAGMTWEEFASRVRTFQIGFMGEPNEVSPGKGEFHENPASCICEYPEASLKDSSSRIQGILSHKQGMELEMKKGTGEMTEHHQQDIDDTDYVESENVHEGKVLPNRAYSDSTTLSKLEQPKLEDIFLD